MQKGGWGGMGGFYRAFHLNGHKSLLSFKLNNHGAINSQQSLSVYYFKVAPLCNNTARRGALKGGRWGTLRGVSGGGASETLESDT